MWWTGFCLTKLSRTKIASSGRLPDSPIFSSEAFVSIL
nr:MAG TPA: hypothetical protein [Caudoviricetes sp.]